MSYIQAVKFNTEIHSSEPVKTQKTNSYLFCYDQTSTTDAFVNTHQSHTTTQNKNITNRKTLNDEEKIKYVKIYNSLNKEMKTKFMRCLNSGKLLQTDSENKNTVLDCLYKIFATERTTEVNSKTILKECINILDNPYIITQIDEDIPEKYLDKVASYVYKKEGEEPILDFDIDEISDYMQQTIEEIGSNIKEIKQDFNKIKEKILKREVESCVPASIEFLLASKFPADFLQIVEGLTSKNKEFKRTVDYNKINLTDNEIFKFRTPFRIKQNGADLTLKADEGAYILADIQKEYQDNNERTTTDILFQSLVANVSTKGTYNSILDENIFSTVHGLDDTEEEYALKVLTGRSVKNLTIKDYKDNCLIAEKIDTAEVKEEIENYILKGECILIGINCSDSVEVYTEGHELTIVGKTKEKDGKEYYLCKDTAREETEPVKYEKDYILEHLVSIKSVN